MKKMSFVVVFLILCLVVEGVDVTGFIYYLNTTTTINYVFFSFSIISMVLIGALAISFIWQLFLIRNKNKINKFTNYYYLKRNYNVMRFDEFIDIVYPRYVHDKGNTFFVSFCAFNDVTLIDSNHSPSLVEYNGFFIDFVVKFFKESKVFKFSQYKYCFDNNTFLFYFDCEYNQIEKMMNAFEQEAYKIATDHDLRLFVQPVFGIYRVEKGIFKKFNMESEIKELNSNLRIEQKSKELVKIEEAYAKKAKESKKPSRNDLKVHQIIFDNDVQENKDIAEAASKKVKLLNRQIGSNMRPVSQVSLFDAINAANIARLFAQNNYERNVIYTSEMSVEGHIDSDRNVNNIVEGLRKGEFVVYYQPKFNLKSKKFSGTEALVRWDSSRFGIVSPLRFISVAEHSGIIHEIDMFVLEAVCKDIVNWSKRGHEILPVSVNFSLFEFFTPNFLEDIKALLEKYNVNPAYIEIEITEQTNSANSFLIISILKKIKAMNIKILMDDFGVGFSNINSLKKLPVDVIKLDKIFIDDIVTDIRSREMVNTIISFCHTLNLSVVAEGVDSEDKLNILKGFNCDVIQGFYYSKPLPKLELDRFLANNKFETKGSNEL
jgi:EAL domain-containing protein (putative c-di-GMP-specific phosphodiesterase class I)